MERLTKIFETHARELKEMEDITQVFKAIMGAASTAGFSFCGADCVTDTKGPDNTVRVVGSFTLTRTK